MVGVKAVNVRPSAELRKRMDEHCERSGMFVSELVRRALDEYLAAREGRKELFDAERRKRDS